MKRLLSTGASVLLSLCCVLPASAALVVYSNEAVFAAASGATLHALNSGVTGSSVSTVDGELTLSTAGIPGSTTIFTDWTTFTGADRLVGVELAISGVESFNSSVNLGADRYAFGFGIYESTNNAAAGCNFVCVDSTFTITLKNNGLVVGSSFTLLPDDDVAVFWGVHTDYAFDAIEIRETIGTADNEIFGTFYTGRSALGAVPEPGTLLLVGAGLAAAGLRRRPPGAPRASASAPAVPL